MFKEIHYEKLVKHQKYYFIKDEFNKIKISTPGEYLGKNIHNHRIFTVTGSTKKFRRNPEPWVLDMVHHYISTKIWIDATQTKFYLKITTKEYKEKLIEKFKETALRILLKRIVNEDFEW
jgi:hypothetical protein